jgi:hypothetical protein
VGSIADELSAGVQEGRVRRRELGEYMRSKGYQDSATTRGLGSAVKMWGSLAKVELASDTESKATEDAYIPCDGAYASLDGLLRRPATDRFAFKLEGSFHRVSRYTESPVLLSADVVANESSTNCKAKINVIPSSGREVQV